jgi:hypothetical protein
MIGEEVCFIQWDVNVLACTYTSCSFEVLLVFLCSRVVVGCSQAMLLLEEVLYSLLF